MLARFRFPHAQIRDALLQLDDGKLSIDNLIAIKQYVPTTDEVCSAYSALGADAPQIESIRGFEGEVATLASSDQYFHEVSARYPQPGLIPRRFLSSLDCPSDSAVCSTVASSRWTWRSSSRIYPSYAAQRTR